MKKLIFAALVAVAFASCNGYIEKYEDVCADACDRIKVATTTKEVNDIFKQTRSELQALDKEYPKEALKYKKADEKDKKAYKRYQRRIKARNKVTNLMLGRVNAMKKAEAAKKKAGQE